ncbi:MAG: S-layer homology domain-containing protein [Butyricicoccus sp.]
MQYVTSNSLMNGTSTTAFSPSATMSRGMLMTVLARYAGESTEGGTVWYEKGMNWAKNKGISDGSAPNRNITREQLAAMLYRYAGEPDGAADLSAYTDAGSVSAYAEKAVQWCVKNGILTGKTSSTLAPRLRQPARSARQCCRDLPILPSKRKSTAECKLRCFIL